MNIYNSGRDNNDNNKVKRSFGIPFYTEIASGIQGSS